MAGVAVDNIVAEKLHCTSLDRYLLQQFYCMFCDETLSCMLDSRKYPARQDVRNLAADQ